MKNKKLFIILTTLVAMFATDWSFAGKLSNTENSAAVFPDTSTWVLTRIGGTKAKQQTGSKIFIAINKTENKVSGYTSCNTFHGKIVIQDTSLAVSGIVIGKRECDVATTELESLFSQTLQKTTSWKIEGTSLLLYDKGTLILEFIKSK